MHRPTKSTAHHQDVTSMTSVKTSRSVHSALSNAKSSPPGVANKPHPPRPPARTVSRPSPPSQPTVALVGNYALGNSSQTLVDSPSAPPAGCHFEAAFNNVYLTQRRNQNDLPMRNDLELDRRVLPSDLNQESISSYSTLTSNSHVDNPAKFNESPQFSMKNPVRKNPSRSSITSSSITSVDSFDSSNFYHAQPFLYQESMIDETDSGCPSGDLSASSTSSSMEIPAVKRPSKTYPSANNRTHYIQMLLRADDLIATAVLKEDKDDLHGAVKLFEQASLLLQSCVDPLKSCPQLSQALAVKQTDCYKKLRVLHDKINTRRADEEQVFHETVASTLVSSASILATLPRRTRELAETGETVSDTSLKRMHRSRRKAKNLGSRESNRSLPDLCQAVPTDTEEPDNVTVSHTVGMTNRNLSTFQVPVKSFEWYLLKFLTFNV